MRELKNQAPACDMDPKIMTSWKCPKKGLVCIKISKRCIHKQFHIMFNEINIPKVSLGGKGGGGIGYEFYLEKVLPILQKR